MGKFKLSREKIFTNFKVWYIATHESFLHEILVIPLPPMTECKEFMKVLSSCRFTKILSSKVSCYNIMIDMHNQILSPSTIHTISWCIEVMIVAVHSPSWCKANTTDLAALSSLATCSNQPDASRRPNQLLLELREGSQQALKIERQRVWKKGRKRGRESDGEWEKGEVQEERESERDNW